MANFVMAKWIVLLVFVALRLIEAVTVHDALSLHQHGDLAGAKAIYEELLKKTPNDIDSLHLLGLVYYSEALDAVKTAESSDSGLDVLARPLLTKAETLVRSAWERAGSESSLGHAIMGNLGLILRQKGDLQGASEVVSQLVLQRDIKAEARDNALLTLYAAWMDYGRVEEPLRMVQMAPSASRSKETAILASVRLLTGSGEDAAIKKATELLLQFKEEVESADVGGEVTSFRKELAAELAIIHHKAGRFKEAREGYNAILAEDPSFSEAAVLLASMRLEEGDPASAVEDFYRLAASSPPSSSLLNNLGAALMALSRTDEAIVALRSSLELDPTSTFALNNLAVLSAQDGNVTEARELWTEAGGDAALAAAALTLSPVPHSSEFAIEERKQLAAAVTALLERKEGLNLGGASPTLACSNIQFQLVYDDFNHRNEQELIAAMFRRASGVMTGSASGAYTAALVPGALDRPIRIGFCSKFMGAFEPHAMLVSGIIRHLPRPKYHITLLRIPFPGKPPDEELAASADSVVQLSLSYSSNLEVIGGMGLDILIYLDMTSEPMTYFLGHARLARVQAAFWGNPITSGNPAIDYFLSGDVLEDPRRTTYTPEEEPYTEQVVLLGDQAIWYDAPKDLPLDLQPLAEKWTEEQFWFGDDSAYWMAKETLRVKLRTELGLSASTIVLMCAQNVFKLHPSYDVIIRRIMIGAPDAHVVFQAGSRPSITRAFLARISETLGPSLMQRVHFVPRNAGGAVYFRLIAAADVLLHPFPFGGSRTSADGLSLGVPVVAKATSFLRGRMAASFYRTMEMPDMLLEGPKADDAYVRIAVRLGTDASARRDMVRRIRMRSHRIWERMEVVHEWDRFLERAARVEAPLFPG